MPSEFLHWNRIYGSKSPETVSWFQPEATISLEMIGACHLAPDDPILDIGAGASHLVDGLLARGFQDVTLLDISNEALAFTRARLGDDSRVHYVASDVTRWSPARHYALWHDRATFHFLTQPEERAEYVATLDAALAKGGHAVISTFSLEGPERCSNLPVRRYSAEQLASEFAPILDLEESRSEIHRTPSGASQSFLFARFRRVTAP